MGKSYVEENQIVNFGLLGKSISYSFSKKYFTEKFEKLNLINYQFTNFDIERIELFPSILSKYKTIQGFSVTIPYKEQIINYLDEVSDEAQEIGAVNCVKVNNGKLIGFNTDVFGFEKSLKPLLNQIPINALILGTGGASKAVKKALKNCDISFLSVSRNPKNPQEISYQDLSKELMKEHQLIINCTPVGTFPNTQQAPLIPYNFISENHIMFDLIYNPQETLFLKLGKEKGATVKNGLEMLELQAEKSWQIWTND